MNGLLRVIKVKRNNNTEQQEFKLNGIFFPIDNELYLTDIIDLVKLIIYIQSRRKKLQSIKKNIQINLN